MQFRIWCTAVTCLVAAGCGGTTVRPPSPAAPVATAPLHLQVLHAPQLTWLDSRTYLKYELHITNLFDRAIAVDTVAVLADSDSTPLRVYAGELIGRNLMRIGDQDPAAGAHQVDSGQHALLFIWVPAGSDDVAQRLAHRVSFSVIGSRARPVLRTPFIAAAAATPTVLGPPLRGGDWLVGIGPDPDSTSQHVRLLVGVDGRVLAPQRFSADWVRFGSDGRLWRDTIGRNENWDGWGAELLAVADGVIVEVVDSLPDNTPPHFTPGPANRILLNIGGGRYAAYAHLQRGSSRVRAGDHVRKGDVLALVGNSGNSTGPHLHFHLTDAPSAIAAEGMSYVFDRYLTFGRAESSLDDYGDGQRWLGRGEGQVKQRQHPRNGEVIRFCDTSERSGASC